MTLELGRLENVLAREVWPHEASHFTPWLLGNVDVLSIVLGMELVLDRAEHPVGGFSLDLIGRDESTGQVVIVENQLEMSDHTHLGQILTYAAGTNPTTIVWVATGFRPEHRAAIDWLNERTDEDTRFFAVEIQVVQMGTSSPAPAFKLVAQPNDWGKQVRASTNSGPVRRRGGCIGTFGSNSSPEFSPIIPIGPTLERRPKRSWLDLTLAPGAVLSSNFSKQGLTACIYFSSSDESVNDARFRILLQARERFKAALGQPALWDEMEGRKATRIVLLSTFTSVAEAEQWPSMVDWLIDAQARFRAAVAAVGGIPSA